jgi:GAF domain-containing protein
MTEILDDEAADLRRANAELQRRLDECCAERDAATAREAALAEVLDVINRSPGDPGPVFDAILEKATRFCEAVHGQLATYDGEFFRFVAVHGDASFVEEQRAKGLLPPSHGVTWPLIVSGEHFVHMADVRDTELYRSHEGARRFVDVGGGRSLLTVALRKDQTLLGALTIYRQEVRPFSDKQIALLESFAAQAVIAMENARLITETREALEQQTATAEVLGVINSSPGELTPVFDAILEKAHSLCGAAYGSLHVADGEAFRAVAVRGMPQAFADLIRRPFQPGPNHPVRKLIEGAPFAVVINSTEFDDPIIQSALKLGGMRTGLFVPLRKDDMLLGYIVASRPEVRPFADKQIALLQNFAAQAVIAMENARLITETREVLDQQTATAEVLQVINSSPGDLAPVFDAMLQSALNLCGADLGGLYRFDGKAIHPVAVRGGPKAAAEILQQSFVIEPGSSVERLARGEDEVVQVADIVDTEAYRSGAAYRVKFVELTGARIALWVALRQDGTLVGVFVIYRQEVRPFSDKQIALVQNFAAQAVIAMENARLITETREALEQRPRPLTCWGSSTARPAISRRCSMPYWRRHTHSARPLTGL